MPLMQTHDLRRTDYDRKTRGIALLDRSLCLAFLSFGRLIFIIALSSSYPAIHFLIGTALKYGTQVLVST
jgi:hypothetical protein